MSTGAKVVPYRYYQFQGRSFSMFSSYVPEGAELVTEGFTIAWPDGTQGTGRVPFKTEAEAHAYLARVPASFKGMGSIGD